MQRSRRAVLALLTLLVTWGVGAVSAQAGGWLPGPTLTDSLRELPQVAVGPDGSAVVAAVEGVDAASVEVVARRIAPDGTESAALMLGGGDVLDVAAIAGGSTVVAWYSWRADESAVDVRATTLDAAGTPSPIRNVTTLPGDLAGRPVGAVAPDGAVFVAWAENDPDEGPALLRARRIAADGTAAPIAELGRIHAAFDIQLVVSGDGVARLLWPRPRAGGGGGEDVVARIDPAGATSEIVLLTGDVVPDMPSLVAGADGAIAAWQTLSGPSALARRAARLPSSGDVVTAPVTLAEALEPGFNGFDLTLAPGGTATFAWTAVDSAAMVGPLVTRRLATDGSLGPIQMLSTPPSERLDILPLLANGADGTVLTTWLRGTPLAPEVAFTYGSRVIGADGAAVGDVLAVPLPVAVNEAAASTTLTTGAAGDGLLVSFAPAPGGGLSMLTARYDAVPAVRPIPQPDPIVPVPGPGPAPRPGPGADPRPVVTRAPARLKLTTASRVGARVTVSGTLDRRASGRVTVTWVQRVGRRTVRRTATARIARGRFAATVRLPRALARARTAGRLTVSYGGDAHVARASATRTVKATARRAAPRRRASARR
ncbi:MAG TPA: hypothetical protein VLK58_27275 [Conexibacter sp.]|nr:hypothetical protein [Conexibacter sp.]